MSLLHSKPTSPLRVLLINLFLLVTILSSSVALICEPATEGITGVGQENSITNLEKLSVIGFQASINYVYLPPGSTPVVKIVAASEKPEVTVDHNGLVTILPLGSNCEVPEPTLPPICATVSRDSDLCIDAETEDPTESSSASSGNTMMKVLTAPLLFTSRSVGSTLCLFAFLSASLPFAFGAEHEAMEMCTPSLQLEISLPQGALVSSKFGETDHYLAATVDTVTWGYYDPNATAQITMQSGETITVEVITHHASHDYAKMIRGDPAVEEIFAWEAGQTLENKNVPKLPGSGVHLVTGPIEVAGAEVGDVVEIEILELDPRYNPVTGRCFGSNSQKFAGYQYRVGSKRDGTEYVTTGGTEAITIFEFIENDGGEMLYGKPVYMYRFPNMTAPDGSERTFDSNPAVTIPHEYNVGYDGMLMEEEPISYPPGFDDTVVTDDGGIVYMSPDPATLNWKVPLRPHLGTLAVLPNNTENYINPEAPGGASTIPPARFGGNIGKINNDWRIGKGGTMFYNVEVPGAMILVGDTHAAQGDSELAGTAMETSMTTKLRVTLHKAGSLPKKVESMPFPLLETDTQYVIHGFAYANYLDDLENPSDIFSEGATLDLAMTDCFVKTRDWLMDVFDLIEEETIALMTTAVDFGITQVVDGNWGVHADISKWVFEEGDTPFDYSCTPSKGPGRARRARMLKKQDRRRLLEMHGVEMSPEDYASNLYSRVTKDCETCHSSGARELLANKLLDAKLNFAKKLLSHEENLPKL